MKIISNLLTIVLFGILISLSACFGGASKGIGTESSTTGWPYNDPDMGRFEVVPYIEQEAGPGLVLIEGGTFVMGRTEPDVIYDWNNVPRRVTVASFYMDETEVRNVDYREYLNWIKRVFVSYPQVYLKALPDTLVWRKRLAYNEPYVEYYFRHPAYHNYPVVGVSWLQATDYCAWRTDRVNEKLLND
ncbi:MAG: SUMF1/EgtB/PvdO family nonheme iron enzyme, partial [Bacteroidales bacterium]|nr:SUMF1/EgtB/PvdO family nonheme iron enzyme [Bacteroidales bacterium]